MTSARHFEHGVNPNGGRSAGMNTLESQLLQATMVSDFLGVVGSVVTSTKLAYSLLKNHGKNELAGFDLCRPELYQGWRRGGGFWGFSCSLLGGLRLT